MPKDLSTVARDIGLSDDQLTSIIQKAGIPCDSEFNGSFFWLLDPVNDMILNRILLHANKFGEFPVVALPNLNLLANFSVGEKINNEQGLSTITSEALKRVPKIANPSLTSSELFNVVWFLTNIWIDIRQELYRFRGLYWNPLVSFITPAYRLSGSITYTWTSEVNILRANLYEIIDSTFRFLLSSYFNYKNNGEPNTKFAILLQKNDDILRMSGVACLNTSGCKQVAFNLLTHIRRLIAQMCCMLLRRGNDAFVVKNTTEATFVDDLKQVYLLIQKMESFINNG